MTVVNYESPDRIRQHLSDCSAELKPLLKNRLLNERSFIKFAKDRGLEVNGVVKGDPSKLNGLGCFPCDGHGDDGTSLLFHPFRIYPLQRILYAYKCSTEISSSLIQDTAKWNRIADLAILLEPIYWPIVSGRRSRPASISEEKHKIQLEQYRTKVLRLVETLDPDEWQKLHEELRRDASQLDENGPLYLLLRLSKWTQREKIKGRISGALWIRYIAETIRRAFEEAHQKQWLEKDQSTNPLEFTGRTINYGSDRPLDDPLQSPSRLAFHFELFTGSVVRWYVEGYTEYYAVLSVIKEPPKIGIELINLCGNIASEKDNIALKLTDGFAKDREFRRFSMVSFDVDVPENVKFIRRSVENEYIVGFIAAHKPDFEFANFTLKELIEIAAKIYESYEGSADTIRQGNWKSNGGVGKINNAKEFEKRYLELSRQTPKTLKGEEWGRALATYASQHPQRSDDQSERPFWREIRTALQGRTANYDLQRERHKFDPKTFKLINRGK